MGDLQYYRYETSIGADQIRLLCIAGNHRMTMATVPRWRAMSPELKYYALSYAWEGQQATTEICINDKAFKVSPTLLNALRAIVKYFERLEPSMVHYIWIDAICINQASVQEQSAQVPLMRDIYSNAMRVIIWLGSDADGSGSVMHTLAYFDAYDQRKLAILRRPLWFWKRGDLKQQADDNLEQMIYHSNLLEETEGIPRETLLPFATMFGLILSYDRAGMTQSAKKTLMSHYRHELLAPNDKFWRSYCKFMIRPWFTRLWTYQEIMLARDAVVLCGDEQVGWETVRECRTQLDVQNLVDHGILVDILGRNGSTMFRAGFTIYRMKHKSSDGILFLRELLTSLEFRDAARPKDYIYGMLGLLDQSVRDRIQVDYRKSDALVYVEVLALCCSSPYVKTAGSFWIELMDGLGRLSNRSGSCVSGLPSWCPDFSCQTSQESDIKYTPMEFMSDASRRRWKGNAAEISNDLSKLTISALRVDRVRAGSQVAVCHFTSNAMRGSDGKRATWWEFRPLRERFETWLLAASRMFEDAGFTGMSNDLALTECVWPHFMRERTHDQYLDFWKQPEELRQIQHLCKISRELDICTREEAAERLGISIQRCYELTLHMAEVMKWSNGRYYFVTEGGRLGDSEHPAQAGDELFYFPGGALLHILQRRGCNYAYRSKATIFGRMNDFIANLSKKEVMLSSITLD